MERQNVRVGRINFPQGASLGDQLELMQLRRELRARKREDSTLSPESAERLRNIESLMSLMLEELVVIRKLLESSNGEKVASESVPVG